MNKAIGYAISIAGIAVMALSFGLFKLDFPILETLKPMYVTALGVILIVAGVVISLAFDKGKRINQSQEEVPIYEGTGKNRKIVGYRRG
jgi:hypothetical protein